MSSWRVMADCICWGYCSQRLVLPSISVNRKFTVPDGRLCISATGPSDTNGSGGMRTAPIIAGCREEGAIQHEFLAAPHAVQQGVGFVHGPAGRVAVVGERGPLAGGVEPMRQPPGAPGP